MFLAFTASGFQIVCNAGYSRPKKPTFTPSTHPFLSHKHMNGGWSIKVCLNYFCIYGHRKPPFVHNLIGSIERILLTLLHS